MLLHQLLPSSSWLPLQVLTARKNNRSTDTTPKRSKAPPLALSGYPPAQSSAPQPSPPATPAGAAPRHAPAAPASPLDAILELQQVRLQVICDLKGACLVLMGVTMSLVLHGGVWTGRCLVLLLLGGAELLKSINVARLAVDDA